jgi:hypothetical protein
MRGYASSGLLRHRILFHPNGESRSLQLYNYNTEHRIKTPGRMFLGARMKEARR